MLKSPLDIPLECMGSHLEYRWLAYEIEGMEDFKPHESDIYGLSIIDLKAYVQRLYNFRQQILEGYIPARNFNPQPFNEEWDLSSGTIKYKGMILCCRPKTDLIDNTEEVLDKVADNLNDSISEILKKEKGNNEKNRE